MQNKALVVVWASPFFNMVDREHVDTDTTLSNRSARCSFLNRFSKMRVFWWKEGFWAPSNSWGMWRLWQRSKPCSSTVVYTMTHLRTLRFFILCLVWRITFRLATNIWNSHCPVSSAISDKWFVSLISVLSWQQRWLVLLPTNQLYFHLVKFYR